MYGNENLTDGLGGTSSATNPVPFEQNRIQDTSLRDELDTALVQVTKDETKAASGTEPAPLKEGGNAVDEAGEPSYWDTQDGKRQKFLLFGLLLLKLLSLILL